MLTEASIDRFRFGCGHCGHVWTLDYQVRHVEGGHGWSLDCYSRLGCRVTAPTSPGNVRCPQCQGQAVSVQLVSTAEDHSIAVPSAAAG